MNLHETSARSERPEVGLGPVSMDVQLEDIAIGDVAIDVAARTIAGSLRDLDDAVAHELYEALRSWTWKSMDARRRDEELTEWLDVIGRVASHLESGWKPLSLKLEAFAELVQASIMISGTSVGRGLATRKHVQEILAAVQGKGGRIRRQELIEKLGLKDANLSRIAAPLQDEGWLRREFVGREVFYGLTEKGRQEWSDFSKSSPVIPEEDAWPDADTWPDEDDIGTYDSRIVFRYVQEKRIGKGGLWLGEYVAATEIQEFDDEDSSMDRVTLSNFSPKVLLMGGRR